METYFIQMHSHHTQEIEGVKEVHKIDGDYIFLDENDKTITCVPGTNMSFYTMNNEAIGRPGILDNF